MEIEKCFKRLLIKNPFYGLFCLSMPKEITRKVTTLCVSRNGISCQLNINPDFWEKHTDDEQLALLQHELGHIALQHMFICESFNNQHLFNIAADCEVNSYIENLPKTACTSKALSMKLGLNTLLKNGLGTKRYYEEIQKHLQQQQAQAQNPQQPCNGGQGGSDRQHQSQSCQGNHQDSQSQQSPQSSSPSEAPSADTPKDQDSQQQNNPQKKEQQPSSSQEQPREPENQQQPDNTQEEPQDPQEQQQRQQERGQDDEEDDSQKMPDQYPEGFEEFNPIDDHSHWKDFQNIPEATQQLISNNINSILKQTAEQVEKMHGTIPGELTDIIEKLKQKRPEVFNWKAYFRRLLGSIYDVNIRSTRRKPSKRFEDAAGIQHKKKVSILVAIDTSGSVSEKELKEPVG